jgi:hypothetical protein
MNRKRDLENLSSLYEEGFGANVLPSRSRPDLRSKPIYSRAQGPQMDAIKTLNKIGWSVNKERTRIDGIPTNEVLLSKNTPRSREEAEVLLYVDEEGNINGQPYQAAIADLEEDEQSSAFGQELADKEEDQNPVQNYEDEESYDEDYETTEGKFATYTVKPSLDDIRRGFGLGNNIKRGKIVQDLGKTVLVDIGNSFIELSKDELDNISREENAEDLGPNQEPESWGDEAMGAEAPGQTSQRFAQDTPDDPASGGSRNIDDPDEEEQGDESLKKESYSSHGDRDMTLLAENYLNIKKYE